ncbi:MAG: hypothetical protein GY788_15585 [bacterium]|nr:hypothetical protein [bacterium]
MAYMLPSVAELLHLEDQPNRDACCIRVRLGGPSTDDELARRLAISIVHRLTEPVPGAFNSWYAHLNGGPPLSDRESQELLAYIGADFSDPKDTTRIEGAVVEHLWASIAEDLEGGWGRPLHVEHDHFSVIDHGPDGLSVYEIGVPDLAFRLWESKRHSSQATVTRTITAAARQLRDNGPAYLARISKVLQTNRDSRVAQLGGTIVRAWQDKDSTSSVGVSVGHQSEISLPARPFSGLRRHFGYRDTARREVVLIGLADFPGLAEKVRAFMLDGIA